MGVPKPFPNIEYKDIVRNPAFVLFGSRFYADQTTIELLAEFLMVIFTNKWIGPDGPIQSPLPSLYDLENWASTQGKKLKYGPEIRLNLKLLSLLRASPLDSRHTVHKTHYQELSREFSKKVQSHNRAADEVQEWLEDFLKGFQGAGFDRTWCAQNFYPIVRTFLVQETIWNHTFAKRNPPAGWLDTIYGFRSYYSVSRHRFLARGGELLYLQQCNLFSGKDVNGLAKELGYNSSDYQLDSLYQCLQQGFEALEIAQLSVVNELADFIENLDSVTHEETNKNNKLECDWCPEESWREAYLFAVEMSRILLATLGPIERLELLEFGCAMQVLRSMCAQSVRYGEVPSVGASHGNILGYAWLFSPQQKSSRQQRLASCENVRIVFRMIQTALKNEDIIAFVGGSGPATIERDYGHKYFNLLGKRLGIIYPPKGAEPRFVVTDQLIRYLVLSTIEPGKSCTYEEFKRRIYAHHGIAVEGQELEDAVIWSGLPLNSSVQPVGDSWFAQMLRAGGFLVELSDGCSLVRNPYDRSLRGSRY